ncbi:unknown [Suid gammaherpesvirus 3]|uniref:Cytoplasmic envelopment protein 3 n=1 Tax=Suid gammaherpesvirus 3 TaxID=1960249 RepID=Q8JJQ3_9GAMA|nr:unknown [Porcine lymphotropic herpesvirus 1]AAM22137.1 unknown [Porcine lymphotropic herpesvirus 1]
MGLLISMCFRRHNSIMDVEGRQINVEDDFEEFTENDELLMETPQSNKKRPPTPYTDVSIKISN